MKKSLIFTFFIGAIMLSSLQTSASTSSELISNSSDVLKPNTSMFDNIKNPVEFLKMLFTLESANFTDDTVYYSSTHFSNTYEIPLQLSQELKINFDPELVIIRLLGIITHLEEINTSIITPSWIKAEDYWMNATFWDDVIINKSSFETSNDIVDIYNFREYFTLMAAVASSPGSFDELNPIVSSASYEEIVATINHLENLPLNEKSRIIYMSLWNLLGFNPLVILWIGYNTLLVTDITNFIEFKNFAIKFFIFLNRLKIAYDGLSETDEPIMITQKIVTDITKQVTVEGGRLTLFYDPDRSVIETLDNIKDNQAVEYQPFTGDETFTFATQYHVSESIWGEISVLNSFTGNAKFSIFENSHTNLEVRKAIEGFWLRALGPQYLKIKAYLNPNTIQNVNRLKPIRTAWSDFKVSMLKIDDLDFYKLPDGSVKIKNLNFTYISHNAQGLYAFNDTNNNNIMDVGIRTDVLSPGNYYANTSEAVGRVMLLGFDNRTYQRPTTENDVLSFGRSITDVNATIIPFGQSVDLAIANSTANTVHTISEIGQTFHYSVDGATSNLKYDYIMGNWSDNEELEGLSLSYIISTTVIDLQSTRQISSVENENETVIDPTADTAKIRTLKFNADIAPDFEVKLDEIPYLWDGTTNETAYGMLIPLKFMNFFGSIMTTNGEITRSFTTSIYVKRYLYAISYPVWDGKSILHDPVFSTVSGTAKESEWTDGENTSNTGVPGFELLTLLAIPIIYSVRRFKKQE